MELYELNAVLSCWLIIWWVGWYCIAKHPNPGRGLVSSLESSERGAAVIDSDLNPAMYENVRRIVLGFLNGVVRCSMWEYFRHPCFLVNLDGDEDGTRG